MKFLKASDTPLTDIQRIAYPGQDPKRKMYRSGYEYYMNAMPQLNPSDPLVAAKVEYSARVMGVLAERLYMDPWLSEDAPGPFGFDRTILALEPPIINDDMTSWKEGAEIVVARWGVGHTSPVHGHAAGYIHEELLFGKMRVNTYQMVKGYTDLVRPVETTIHTRGTIASLYGFSDPTINVKRQTLVHNFTALEQSVSMHFLAEHTRDGRDNTFRVEHFATTYGLEHRDLQEINIQQSLALQNGEVVLVRSSNVPDYGDHFIVVTGRPVNKPWGLRVQEFAILAEDSAYLLNEIPKDFVLLKLRPGARNAFHDFHNIRMRDGAVVRPEF